MFFIFLHGGKKTLNDCRNLMLVAIYINNVGKSLSLVLACFLFVVSSIYAQQGAGSAYRISRLSVSVDWETQTGSDYKVKKDGELYEKGEMGEYSKTGFRVNAPISYMNGFLLMLAGKYTYLHEEFSPTVRHRDIGLGDNDHHIYGANLQLMGRKKLFGKSLDVFGFVSADAGEFGFGRIYGMATGILRVHETSRASFGVGLIGLVNTFSPFPVFPIFSYRYRFMPNLVLDMTIPQINLKYQASKTDALSVGMTIDSENFYVRTSDEDFPRNSRYSRCVVKPEFVYEKRLSDAFSLTAETGVALPMSSYIHERNGSRRLSNVNMPMKPFLKIGVKYNVY